MTEQEDNAATARTEIAIESALRKLERATKRKVSRVSVDTQNHATLSVEVYLADREAQ